MTQSDLVTELPSDIVKINIIPTDDSSSCFRMPYKLAGGGDDSQGHSITTSLINSIIEEQNNLLDNSEVLSAGSASSSFDGDIPTDFVDEFPTEVLIGGMADMSTTRIDSLLEDVPTELLADLAGMGKGGDGALGGGYDYESLYSYDDYGYDDDVSGFTSFAPIKEDGGETTVGELFSLYPSM